MWSLLFQTFFHACYLAWIDNVMHIIVQYHNASFFFKMEKIIVVSARQYVPQLEINLTLGVNLH